MTLLRSPVLRPVLQGPPSGAFIPSHLLRSPDSECITFRGLGRPAYGFTRQKRCFLVGQRAGHVPPTAGGPVPHAQAPVLSPPVCTCVRRPHLALCGALWELGQKLRLWLSVQMVTVTSDLRLGSPTGTQTLTLHRAAVGWAGNGASHVLGEAQQGTLQPLRPVEQNSPDLSVVTSQAVLSSQMLRRNSSAKGRTGRGLLGWLGARDACG